MNKLFRQVFAALCFSIPLPIIATDSEYARALKALSEGKAELALLGFCSDGRPDAALLYNTSLALKLLGKKGMARLALRRAELLWPLFKDRSLLLESLGERTSFLSTIGSMIRSVSTRQLQMIILFLLLLLVITLTFALKLVSFLLLLFLAIPVSVGIVRAAKRLNATAVVIDTGNTRLGPGENFEAISRVQDGDEGLVSGSIAGFYFVSFPDGRRGWLEKSKICLVNVEERKLLQPFCSLA